MSTTRDLAPPPPKPRRSLNVYLEQRERFSEQLRALPDQPGVYLMKVGDTTVYVGKARSLQNRVRSYFGSPHNLAPKTREMVARLTDFEIIVTDSELEALLLECNLIKKHRPHYNVLLKDDKTYPYLKVNVQEDWAQVFITRQVKDDGARYFGPYANIGSARRMVEILNKLFPYRSCTRTITGKDPRPCLDFHINLCLGPCIGAVEKEAYDAVIRQMVSFLEGKPEPVLRSLRKEMEEAAENLQFERAALLRDRIRLIERLTERQKITSTVRGDQDIIAFAREDGEACVEVFFIRDGKLNRSERFFLDHTEDEEAERVMQGFLEQFYDNVTEVPEEIVLEHAAEEMEILRSWLSKKRGGSVQIAVPRRGEKRKLVELAAENARVALQQMRAKWLADREKTLRATDELQEALALPAPPRRIECYDISNTQGTNSVGSMVVFENGQPKRSDYRRFRIKTVEGANDFASMREVLRRRFARAKSAGLRLSEEAEGGPGGWAITPDLIVIDGGKGQLNAALEAARDLGLEGLPMIGLAKENEEVFLPGMSDPVVLPRDSQGLYLLQRVRDEAHRFAVTYHRQVRAKKGIASVLDEVPGIGPKRKSALLRHFGSVQGLRDATVEEIAAVKGMTLAAAQRVKEVI